LCQNNLDLGEYFHKDNNDLYNDLRDKMANCVKIIKNNFCLL